MKFDKKYVRDIIENVGHCNCKEPNVWYDAKIKKFFCKSCGNKEAQIKIRYIPDFKILDLIKKKSFKDEDGDRLIRTDDLIMELEL
jgi:hypothetical protein